MKLAVRVKTISNLPSYIVSGVQKTHKLTAQSNGILTIDNISLSLNDRVLVTRALDLKDNGIYYVSQEGTPTQKFILTRTVDASGDPLDVNATVSSGMTVFVNEGLTSNGVTYELFDFNGVVDTDFQTYRIIQNNTSLSGVKIAARLYTTSLPGFTTSGSKSSKIITATAVGLLYIDNISVQQNDRILINFPSSSNSGIYTVINTGQIGGFILQRSSDFNGEIGSQVYKGMSVLITEGSFKNQLFTVVSNNNYSNGGTNNTGFIDVDSISGNNIIKFENLEINSNDNNLNVNSNSIGISDSDMVSYTYKQTQNVLNLNKQVSTYQEPISSHGIIDGKNIYSSYTPIPNRGFSHVRGGTCKVTSVTSDTVFNINFTPNELINGDVLGTGTVLTITSNTGGTGTATVVSFGISPNVYQIVVGLGFTGVTVNDVISLTGYLPPRRFHLNSTVPIVNDGTLNNPINNVMLKKNILLQYVQGSAIYNDNNILTSIAFKNITDELKDIILPTYDFSSVGLSPYSYRYYIERVSNNTDAIDTGVEIEITKGGQIIDPASGVLIFSNPQKAHSNIVIDEATFFRINYYKYAGVKGVVDKTYVDSLINATSPTVVPSTNLSSDAAILQVPINPTIPDTKVWFFSVSNINNTEYRSGYIQVQYNNLIATLYETATESRLVGDSSAISFDAKVINNNLYIYTLITNDTWNITLTLSPVFLNSTKTITDNIGDNAPTVTLIKSYDSSIDTNADNDGVIGVILYYTITEIPSTVSSGYNNVRSGNLIYTYTSNNMGNTTNNITINNENILPLIGDTSLSNTNVTFSTSNTPIIGTVGPTGSNNLNLFINFPSTNRKYRITTYESIFKNATIITAISSTQIPVKSINRTSTNYVNYKYILQDDLDPDLNDPTAKGPVTLFGEFSVIWDNFNNPQLYGINSNNIFSSIIAGPSVEVIPSTNITNNITFSAVVNADPSIIDIRLQLGAAITSAATPIRLYTLYLFEQSSLPIIIAPISPPIINEINGIVSSNAPALQTIVLHTLNPLNTNGVIFRYTVSSTDGTSRRTEEILTVFTTNPPPTATPPGTGKFTETHRQLVPDIGTFPVQFVYVRYTNTNPELVIDVTTKTWNITYQIIDMMNNFTSSFVINNNNTVTNTDIIPLNDSGATYYYLIKSSNNTDLRLGDLFISYEPKPTFAAGLKVINDRYASNPAFFPNYPADAPLGSIGDTESVVFDISYSNPNIFTNLTIVSDITTFVAPATAIPTTITVYLYKVSIQSNNIQSTLNQTNSIEYSPLNIPTTSSVFTGKNVQINDIDVNDTLTIFEFDSNNTIIPLFSTTVNPNRNPERITTYVLNYILYSVAGGGGGSDTDSFRTGELYLQWQGGVFIVNDRYTSDIISRTPIDKSIDDITFNSIAIGNNNKLQVIHSNGSGSNNKYSLKLICSLTLSNNINIVNSNQVSIPGTIISGGNTVIRQYQSDNYNGVKLFYVLTTQPGITPVRKRIGVILLTWDVNTISSTLLIDNNNSPSTNYEIGDTSGITFLSDYITLNGIVRILINVAVLPFPQFWNINFTEIYT